MFPPLLQMDLFNLFEFVAGGGGPAAAAAAAAACSAFSRRTKWHNSIIGRNRQNIVNEGIASQSSRIARAMSG